MATKRLTGEIREKLAIEILKHRFSSEIDKFYEQHKLVAEEAYNLIYTKDEQEVMEKLPHGWLPEANSLSFYINSTQEFIYLYFNGRPHSRYFNGLGTNFDPIQKRILSKHDSFRINIEKFDSITELEKVNRSLTEKIQEAHDKVYSILNERTNSC